MTAIPDLAPYPDVALPEGRLVAVGWLGRAAGFSPGYTDEAVFRTLRALCKDPWRPALAAGVHGCDLCQFDRPAFSGELFVPHAGRIYVAPVGIVHYIGAHWYRPPDTFLEAVTHCPPMRSTAYFRSLLDCGGRALLGARRTVG
ncbi:hypothetical protein [Tahibacter amnicola]|uniref:DUF7919 domain-containing protein n=1 Tax=Tahibacter amnicola TaxID=2976241 RepID=A0ABY6BKS6_9GAMM|nr:hypothetical protein [Tahibacter amnicola]UXI70216.1 hypothetical protein N4264_11455 [Tahibacter amnicola]